MFTEFQKSKVNPKDAVKSDRKRQEAEKLLKQKVCVFSLDDYRMHSFVGDKECDIGF